MTGKAKRVNSRYADTQMVHRLAHKVKWALKGLAGHTLHGYPLRFDYTKKELIDGAFSRLVPAPISFADLGGVWRIDGAYTFYILENYDVSSAFLVDTDFTDGVLERSRSHPNLVLVNQNFGSPAIREKIDSVDVLLLFDVLLHQVKPDWNQVLEMYAPVTDCFVIYNQQFTSSDTSVRLLDLGFDKYFELVRVKRKSELYKNLVEKTYETHPGHKRIWRDIHNVWQWGITDRDLIHTLETIGFSLVYQKNWGQFSNFKNFENHAFIFRKQRPAQ